MYFLFLQGEVPTDSFFHALHDEIFHRTTCYQVLNHQLAIAKDPVTERVEAGFIHPDDAKYNLFFLWRVSEENLQFVVHFNSVHATIKFKFKPGESFNFSTRSINFLMVTSRPPSKQLSLSLDLWMQPLTSSD